MSKRNASEFEHNGYFLIEPCARYKTFRRGHFDADVRQTRRVSLGTTDRTEAQLRLIEFATTHPIVVKRPAEQRAAELLANAQPLDADGAEAAGALASAATLNEPRKVVPQFDLPLTKCVIHYFAMRRATLDNPDRVNNSLANALEVWGDIMVLELDATRQHEFINTLRAWKNPDGSRQLTDWTIKTRLSCLYAAIHFCQTHGLLRVNRLDNEPILPPRLTVDQWLPPAHLPPRAGKLSFEDCVKLMRVAATREHWWTFMIGEIGTAARPMAFCEATPDNVEFFTDGTGAEHCNIKLLADYDANGIANVQSAKGRATIRCAPTLARWLKYWNGLIASRPAAWARNYVIYKGVALNSAKFFKEIARRAGVKLPKNQASYALRRFILSWLANNGCPREQRHLLGGHAFDSGSADVYVELEPGYLAEAAALIEKLYQQLAARIAERSLLEPNSSASPAAYGFKKSLPGTLEEQPEMRYAAWFWGEFQKSAWRLEKGALHERGIKMRTPPQHWAVQQEDKSVREKGKTPSPLSMTELTTGHLLDPDKDD